MRSKLPNTRKLTATAAGEAGRMADTAAAVMVVIAAEEPRCTTLSFLPPMN